MSGESALFYSTSPVYLLSGETFPFDESGPTTASGITNDGFGTVTLAKAGVYRVSVSAYNAVGGALEVSLDGIGLSYTRFGMTSGGTVSDTTTLVDAPTAGATLAMVAAPTWQFLYDPYMGTPATILIELVKEY